MLRISKLADYGTVVMVYLTVNQAQLHNAKDIAAKTHLAVPTVSKLLKLLANYGLLSSQRGAKGGYNLAKKPEAISVADIINAVEGPTGLTQCSEHQGSCDLEAVCHVRGNWQLISHAITTALESVSLADLAKPKMTVARIDVSDIQNIATRDRE